jgi:hypothetical protein
MDRFYLAVQKLERDLSVACPEFGMSGVSIKSGSTRVLLSIGTNSDLSRSMHNE